MVVPPQLLARFTADLVWQKTVKTAGDDLGLDAQSTQRLGEIAHIVASKYGLPHTGGTLRVATPEQVAQAGSLTLPGAKR